MQQVAVAELLTQLTTWVQRLCTFKDSIAQTGVSLWIDDAHGLIDVPLMMCRCFVTGWLPS